MTNIYVCMFCGSEGHAYWACPDMIRQERLIKYGSRKCNKCDKLLENEVEPDYWYSLCDEHSEELKKLKARIIIGEANG